MPTDLQVSGHKLQVLREKAELTQQQLETKTAELEERGIGKRVFAQQISRIEKGQIDKPPILDLISIGRVLNLSTAQILTMYGLWYEPPVREMHPTFRDAQDIYDTLDAEDQDQMLSWVEFAIQQARALQARKSGKASGKVPARAKVAVS